MTSPMTGVLTREQLLALPPTTGLVLACAQIDIGRTKAYEMARAGELPFRTLRLGKCYRVITADLLRVLGIADAA